MKFIKTSCINHYINLRLIDELNIDENVRDDGTVEYWVYGFAGAKYDRDGNMLNVNDCPIFTFGVFTTREEAQAHLERQACGLS